MLTEIVPVLLFIVSEADLVVVWVPLQLKGLHPHDLLGVVGLVHDPDHDLAARSQAEDQVVTGSLNNAAIAEAIRSFLAHALLQVVGKADLAAVELAFGEGKPADHHIIGGRRAVATAPFPSRRLPTTRSEEHTSELQSRENLVCRLLLEKK